MTEEKCETNKIDRYISREFQIISVIVIVIVLGSFYAMVLSPIQKQNQDIEVIKNNHLKHIEDNITEIRKKQADRDISDAKRDEKLVEILTVLRQHDNNLLK